MILKKILLAKDVDRDRPLLVLSNNKIPNLAVITISNDRITAFLILFVIEIVF
jgi:hypothetical protein